MMMYTTDEKETHVVGIVIGYCVQAYVVHTTRYL